MGEGVIVALVMSGYHHEIARLWLQLLITAIVANDTVGGGKALRRGLRVINNHIES